MDLLQVPCRLHIHTCLQCFKTSIREHWEFVQISWSKIRWIHLQVKIVSFEKNVAVTQPLLVPLSTTVTIIMILKAFIYIYVQWVHTSPECILARWLSAVIYWSCCGHNHVSQVPAVYWKSVLSVSIVCKKMFFFFLPWCLL